MAKVIGMIVALALFGALPAVAAAQTTPGGGGDTVSSGNTQDGEIEQDAQGGGDAVGGDSDGDGHSDGGDAAGGDGNAGNQAAICQQNAGGDADCAIDQRQNFGDTWVDRDGDGVNDRHEHRQGVGHVGLARTGFDAWVLALIGVLAVVGGVAMLATQRRRVSS